MSSSPERLFALPDCRGLYTRISHAKGLGREYRRSDSWAQALPTKPHDIKGFDRYDHWIDGFCVYVRLLPLARFIDQGTESDSSLKLLGDEESSLWVSLDTEFVGGEGVCHKKDGHRVRWDGHRQVVSWQFSFSIGDSLCELLITSKTDKPLCIDHALNLIGELSGAPFYYCRDGWHLKDFTPKKSSRKNKKPEPWSVTLFAHGGRVDLSTFIGSPHLFKHLNDEAIFNTENYKLAFYRDDNCNTIRYVDITVRDTMGFTAKGTSLKKMGGDLGIEKLDMTEADYMDMGGVFEREPERFAEYACRDTEICYAYLARFLSAHDVRFGVTSSNLAGQYVKRVVTERHCNGIAKLFDRKFRGCVQVKGGLKKHKRSDTFYISTYLDYVTPLAADFSTYCRHAYKGGMNSCSKPGYYDKVTFDYDLTSAYPLCMGSVSDIDWDADTFSNTFEDVDLTPDNFPMNPYLAGAGSVTFEFPKDCYQPCIVIRAEDNLVFPRTSRGLAGVYVTMPEVVCALELGAKVHAIRFVIARTVPGDGVLKDACKGLIDARSRASKHSGKKSVPALAWKLIANSVYGKISQAVVPKRYRDLETYAMCDLGTSPITSPYHAAFCTALARCVMAAATNELHKLGYSVYSATTDGFISDAPKDVIDTLPLLGLREKLADTRAFYTDCESNDIFEIKHTNDSLLNFTTRGNVAPNEGGVLAHAGLKKYNEVGPSGDSTSVTRKLFMGAIVFRKENPKDKGKIKFGNNEWVNAYDMLRFNEDFHTTHVERSVNPNFDLKRKPCFDTLIDSCVPVLREDDTEGDSEDDDNNFSEATGSFACFDTAPYEDVAEFYTYKSWSKPLALVDGSDYLKLKESVKTGKRIKRGRKHRDLIRYAVIAHRAGRVTIPELEELRGQARLDWLNSKLHAGERPFTADDWKNAFKQRVIDALPDYDVYAEAVIELGGALAVFAGDDAA